MQSEEEGADQGGDEVEGATDDSSLPWQKYDVVIGSDITHGDNHGEMVFGALVHFLKKDGDAWIAR